MQEIQHSLPKLVLSDEVIRQVASSDQPASVFLEGEGDIVIEKQPIVSDFLITAKKNQETIGSVVIREIDKAQKTLVLGKNTREDFRRRGITTELKRIVIEYMKENGLKYIRGEIYLYKFASFLSNLSYRDRQTGKALKIIIPEDQKAKIQNMIAQQNIDWDMSVTMITDIETLVDDNMELEKFILELKKLFDAKHL